MKHSISKKMARRMIILLTCVMFIFEVCSYLFISNIITKESDKYAKTIVSIYNDLILADYANNDLTDEELSNLAISYGNYIVEWYHCDYAYVYERLYIEDENEHIDDTTIKYIAYCSPSLMADASLSNHRVGEVVKFEHTVSEDMIQNQSETFAQISNGNEKTTMLCLKDVDAHRDFFICVEYSYTSIMKEIINNFIIFSVIIAASLLLIYFIVRYLIGKQISKPALEICNSMQDFINNNHSSGKLEINSDDEFAMIASSFNDMTSSIEKYIASINELAMDKSKRQAELDVASRIQQGFLQHQELKTNDYTVNGIMKAAKFVGGDLYDYFELDENRVFLAIADVSDKGIVAAMYMVIALTLIRQYAKLGLSLDKILEHTNNTLCAKNPLSLFATVFLAIYDKRDKSLIYSNAGHNYPYIIGKDLKVLDGAKGALVGLFEDEKYTVEKVNLNDGDILFMYTDGVTEATNIEGKFFTEKRLEDILSDYKNSSRHSLINYVNDIVNDYVGEADPHDDVTMLTLMLNKSIKLELDVDVNEMLKIRECILNLGLSKEKALKICLVIEEYFVNICSYAFPDGIKDNEKIILDIDVSNKIVMKLIDGGMKYNPLDNPLNISEYDMEESIGGLGKFIASANANDISYEYTDNKNVLTITIL